ncbi:MAG TPA: FAD-linked oxidase C-terminal domain-containing protein [bacterium]|nr:FAD-linked oxidase C-terminal domain-containing protein [bacterium]
MEYHEWLRPMSTSSTETRITEQLAKALKAAVKGEVRFDPFSRVLYSTDASIYQIMPVGVVIPRDTDDIAATLRLAADSGTPVLPRGAGTSLAGQSVGRAIILDCSKYMNRIVEIDPAAARARVQPGVVQDELNLAARPHGLRLGPDTATSNRATLGGMMGNNSCGARSIIYGKMIDHVEELSVLLIDGTVLTLRRQTPEEAAAVLREPGRTGNLYRDVARIVEEHRGSIEQRFPKLQRRVSGYNLDALLGDPTDLRRVLIGSEGTLAVITEAVVGLVSRPAYAAVGVVHFHDLLDALEATGEILTLQPSAVELIDRMVLDMTRNQLEYARQLGFVQGDPDALLIVEFSADDPAVPADRLADLERLLRERGVGDAVTRAVSAAEQDNIWKIRKAGQGLLQGIKGDSKPITFVEDTAVPPALLAPYIRRFRDVLAAEGVRAAFYAHASVGVIHVRPLINLKDRGDIEKMKRIASSIGDLVIEFGGTMSGEHGDGLVRSWFIERFFGPEVYEAFVQVKRAFDPPGLMNPGKIVDGPPIDASLRYGPAYRTLPITTHFDWTADGGFAKSVELCSGLGACRKTVDGTMCPSYMVTREEEHSTRGRANLLRAVLSGTLPAAELTGRRLFEALDLCLECKGCKGECPANVDMAKLKYEFLARYHAANGLPLRARLFAHIRTLNRLGAPLAPLASWLASTMPARWVMHRALGIHPARPLPPLARENFFRWWSGRKRANAHSGHHGPAPRGTVALFADTFMVYNYPEVGRAAVALLEGLGFEVMLAPAGCCGRPMISKGLLGQAAALARQNVDAMVPLAEQGIPIVGLEPSCILTFRDEVPDLVGSESAKVVAQATRLVDEFVLEQHRISPLPMAGIGRGRRVLFHGHCHQKALLGSATSRQLLSEAGFAVEEVDSGCCGMAGAFGFEAEHYDISMAIGERRLLPAVRAQAADTAVVAMGVSCRQQIAHGTGRRAMHLVELLAEAMTHGNAGSRDRGNA